MRLTMLAVKPLASFALLAGFAGPILGQEGRQVDWTTKTGFEVRSIRLATWPFDQPRTSVTLRWDWQTGQTSSLDNGTDTHYTWQSLPSVGNKKGAYEIITSELRGYPFPPERMRAIIMIDHRSGNTWWLDTGTTTHYQWQVLGVQDSEGAWEISQNNLGTFPFPENKERVTILTNRVTGAAFSLDYVAKGYAWKSIP